MRGIGRGHSQADPGLAADRRRLRTRPVLADGTFVLTLQLHPGVGLGAPSHGEYWAAMADNYGNDA
jgi:hypothetical protein